MLATQTEHFPHFPPMQASWRRVLLQFTETQILHLPAKLLWLAARIEHELSGDAMATWLSRFRDAITSCADPTTIWPRFALWHLKNVEGEVIGDDRVHRAVLEVRNAFEGIVEGRAQERDANWAKLSWKCWLAWGENDQHDGPECEAYKLDLEDDPETPPFEEWKVFDTEENAIVYQAAWFCGQYAPSPACGAEAWAASEAEAMRESDGSADWAAGAIKLSENPGYPTRMVEKLLALLREGSPRRGSRP